jgi:hypothetical protein
LPLQTVSIFNHYNCNNYRPTTCFLAAASEQSQSQQSSNTNTNQPNPNEFARPILTDKILKTAGGKKRTVAYDIEITANQDECQALALRFDLTNIAALTATMTITRPMSQSSDSIMGGSSRSMTYSNGLEAVQVEGTVQAKVTQTCVRTNEKFEVDVEFPVSQIVKPTATSAASAAAAVAASQPDEIKKELKRQQKKGAGENKNKSNTISQLQRLLEEQDAGGGGGGGLFDEDAMIEDENIYSATTGKLDVGELVAQVFWLNLDPYPKKPGTKPVVYEISG